VCKFWRGEKIKKKTTAEEKREIFRTKEKIGEGNAKGLLVVSATSDVETRKGTERRGPGAKTQVHEDGQFANAGKRTTEATGGYNG